MLKHEPDLDFIPVMGILMAVPIYRVYSTAFIKLVVLLFTVPPLSCSIHGLIMVPLPHSRPTLQQNKLFKSKHATKSFLKELSKGRVYEYKQIKPNTIIDNLVTDFWHQYLHNATPKAVLSTWSNIGTTIWVITRPILGSIISSNHCQEATHGHMFKCWCSCSSSEGVSIFIVITLVTVSLLFICFLTITNLQSHMCLLAACKLSIC
ncbi:hypothetical protein HD554DRAFT_2037505 [Boletus coccyginus]|nr:hypothetical protein HD554DRAFT_2037505 [Boletus coccyginus]